MTPWSGGFVPPKDRSVTPLPVLVRTETADEDGRFVFYGGKLVAVLVRPSDEHEGLSGHRFLERGFGRLDHPCPPVFDGLDPACDWIAGHIGPRT